jgi:hypothetical protein
VDEQQASGNELEPRRFLSNAIAKEAPSSFGARERID